MNTAESQNPEDYDSWIYRIDKNNLSTSRNRLTCFGVEIYDLLAIECCALRFDCVDRDEAIVQRLWAIDEAFSEIKSAMFACREVARVYIRTLSESREWVKVVELSEKMALKGVVDGELYYFHAFALHALRSDKDKSLCLYTLALNCGFDPFWVLYNRGCLYCDRGEYDAAKADLERAVLLRPEHEGAASVLHEVKTKLVNS